MNLALQKRHEQLERWRQNEASSVELGLSDTICAYNDDHDGDNDAADSNSTNKPTTKATKISSSDTTKAVSIKNYSSQTTQQLSQGISLSTGSKTSSEKTKLKTRKSSRRLRGNCDLQVKFTNATLFTIACSNGDIDECRRLLSSNLVNIDVETNDGLTGLHEAAISGNIKMVEFLLDAGANINCIDNEGWTPLHAAASLNQFDIVKLLLERGADATVVNCENLLAYDLARREHVKELLEAYLNGYDIDYLRTQEERVIKADIARWIKNGRYDERSHPITNATVLHVIAAKGYIQLLKLILESSTLKKQIDFEARDNEGFTPLLAASYWSQDDIVEILIENGADISAKANNGYSISSTQLQNYQQYKSQQQQPSATRTVSSSGVSSGTASPSYRQQDDKDNDSYYDKSPQPQPQPQPQPPPPPPLSRAAAARQGFGRRSPNSSLDSSQSPIAATVGAYKSEPTKSSATDGHLLKSQSLDISKSSTPKDYNAQELSVSADMLHPMIDSMTDRELRKSYKELVFERERLKDNLSECKNIWATKERQLERKISELEEESKLIEQLKAEIQRLKDENSSLIRVVSKLSKQH